VTSSSGVNLASLEVVDLSGYTISNTFNTAFAGGANILSMNSDVIKNLSGLLWSDIEQSDPTLDQKVDNLVSQDSAPAIANSAHVLFVNGDSNDTVTLTDHDNNWNNVGVATVLGNQGYNAYIHTASDNTQTVALIDSHIANVVIT
jgi:hypothetical protein